MSSNNIIEKKDILSWQKLDRVWFDVANSQQVMKECLGIIQSSQRIIEKYRQIYNKHQVFLLELEEECCKIAKELDDDSTTDLQLCQNSSF